MEDLNFYIIDSSYARYLQAAEAEARGFSHVPNMDYAEDRKPKFLCGIVLQVSGMNYYVPVSSCKIQKPDNFLIYAANGKVTSSLRFNYMFPVPSGILAVRSIKGEPDPAYRALLAQELRHCIKHQEKIRSLAERTYKRVMLGLDKGLVANSCDFKFLEGKCAEYIYIRNLELAQAVEREQTVPVKSKSTKDKLTAAKIEADGLNAERTAPRGIDTPNKYDRGR